LVIWPSPHSTSAPCEDKEKVRRLGWRCPEFLMSDVLIRVRKFCLFARPALGCAELGVVRRGVVHGGVIQRGAVAALVVGAVWGCGTGTDTDTSANMSSTTGPGASTTSLPPATSLP